MKDIGVGGLVRSCVWLDHVAGVEVLGIGRSALTTDDCAAELAGSQLLINLVITGDRISVSACSLDEPERFEYLFNVGDGPEGWSTVRQFVHALERSGIKSLRSRPIHLGEPGSPDAWTIA